MKKNNKKIKFTSSVISACMVTTNIYPAFASEIVFENDATDIEALEENKNKEVIEESIKNESIGDTEGSEGVSVTEDTYVEDGVIKDIDDEEVELKESLSELPSNDVVVKEDEVLLSDNDIVNIEDQVLLKVINKKLGKGNVTTAVTKEEMKRIESLSYNDQYETVKSLEGLQYAINLKELSLNENDISDVSPLASLTKLEVLNLASNRVSSVEPLASLSELKELDLSYNNITDISGLSSLENLKYLYSDSNKISDIKVIGSLDNLVDLSLSDNQISDISGLSSLENLGRLNLSFNQISDIRVIGLLDNLVCLYLGYNQISDISGLSSLDNLVDLYLGYNQISDISGIGGLKNLEYLNLGYNKISDISGLGGLKKLKVLSLKNNYISDIRELSLLNNLFTVYLNDNSIYDISPVLEIYKNSNNPYLSLDVTGNFIDFTPGSRGFEIYCLLNEVSPLDVSIHAKIKVARLNSDYQFKVEFSNDNVSLELGDIYETSADLVMISMDGDEIYRQKVNINELNYEVADTNIVKINEKNYIESCGEGTTSVKVKYRNLPIFEGSININVYGNVKKPELQFKDNILTIKDTNIGCSSGRAINATNKIESFNGDEEIIKLSNPNWVRDGGYLISEGIKLGEGSGNAEYLKSTSTEFIVNSKEADAVEIEWLSTFSGLEVIITVNGKEMFVGPGEIDPLTWSTKVNVTKLDMEKGDNHIKIEYRFNPYSFPFVSEERAAVDLFGYMMIDSITLTKTCTRVADKLEYRVNSGEWKDYKGPVDFTDSGENTIEVEARAVIANSKSEIVKEKYEVVREDNGSSENEGNGVDNDSGNNGSSDNGGSRPDNDSDEDNNVTDEGVDAPGVEGDFNKDEESKGESPQTGDTGILNYVIMLSGSIAVLLSRLLVIKRDKEK